MSLSVWLTGRLKIGETGEPQANFDKASTIESFPSNRKISHQAGTDSKEQAAASKE